MSCILNLIPNRFSPSLQILPLTPIAVFWFRRDLRLHDSAGLYHALKCGLPVLPLFIFDQNILEALPSKTDARVEFIHQTVYTLKQSLGDLGSAMLVRYGEPEAVWAQLIKEFKIAKVFTNRDWEQYALDRDAIVGRMLAENDSSFQLSKDHVIFEKGEVLKGDGTPYTVFTPYSKRWLEKLGSKKVSDASGNKELFYVKSYPTENYFDNFLKIKGFEGAERVGEMPTLEQLGFSASGISIPPTVVERGVVRNYDKTRDFPAIDGTSKLGIHFRFGTISIREKARHALGLNATFLNELIWRDFYSQILAHFPHVADRPFRLDYERIEWRDAPEDFDRWKNGKTGYPIVDAGMRQLNATGYIHNRVRMIVASFLTKHLLIDWRLGEAYFAEKLLDFDLASNNGGWQWAAGCGTDAAPYFRIFNPTEQTKKFDSEYKYIIKWVPEFGTP